jgi:hypothetical protein
MSTALVPPNANEFNITAWSRYFLHHEAEVIGRVVRTFLPVGEGELKACGPQALTTAHYG